MLDMNFGTSFWKKDITLRMKIPYGNCGWSVLVPLDVGDNVEKTSINLVEVYLKLACLNLRIIETKYLKQRELNRFWFNMSILINWLIS